MVKQPLQIFLKPLRQLLLYVAAFFVFSLVMDFWRGKDLPQAKIPGSVFEDMTGRSFPLAEVSQSQLVVVYFWATWCGPCKVSTPSVQKLAKSYPVISIALQSESTDALVEYIEEGHIAFPVVNDLDRTLANEWGVSVTPTILYIQKGKVVANTSGVSFYPGLWLRAWWLENFG